MPKIYQSDNPGNSFSIDAIEMDEFLPLVEFKDPMHYVVEDEEVIFSDKEVTLSKYLDEDKRKFKVLQVTTEKRKLKLPFTVKKGGSSDWDEDGFVEIKASVQDKAIKILGETKFLTSFGAEFEIELEVTGEEGHAFYLDFYANDDEEDYNKGEYENVHCGRFGVNIIKPNDWVFKESKINLVKQYAAKNQQDRISPGASYTKYHHCTDTHKHIALKLLENPEDLYLGKDQTENRETPLDYERVGESSTSGVRDSLIAKGYAESSKIFTVIDEDGKEVVLYGKPSTTNKNLSGFKDSPSKYMVDNAPSDGYYVFIGAYDDDYHSFTIILNKSNSGNTYTFIDQFATTNFSSEGIELKFKEGIMNFGKLGDFPLKLELYQLRNNCKYANK